MRVTLAGAVSLRVEDEWLFDGEGIWVQLDVDVPDENVSFTDGRVNFSARMPLEISVSESEWSRAVGEVLARSLNHAT